MSNPITRFYTYATALLSKLGRRYSDSFRDASSFIDQVDIVRRAIPDWEQQARSLDQNQVEAALRSLGEIRTGLKELSRKMAAGQGHLAEAGETGLTLLNRLATGAHLTQPENLDYLIQGDSEGLAQYMNLVEQATIRRTLEKVSPEQQALFLEELLKKLEEGKH